MCFIPGCLTKHPMAVPWHYHLFNLFPPTPLSSSSPPPPPPPVAYLYPGDSKEPIKAPQTSSARDNSERESDNTWSIWSPASSPFLWQLLIRKTKTSTSGNSWITARLQLCQASVDKLPLIFHCGEDSLELQQHILDAGCAWVHGLEVLSYFVEIQGNTHSLQIHLLIV